MLPLSPSPLGTFFAMPSLKDPPMQRGKCKSAVLLAQLAAAFSSFAPLFQSYSKILGKVLKAGQTKQRVAARDSPHHAFFRFTSAARGTMERPLARGLSRSLGAFEAGWLFPAGSRTWLCASAGQRPEMLQLRAAGSRFPERSFILQLF